MMMMMMMMIMMMNCKSTPHVTAFTARDHPSFTGDFRPCHTEGYLMQIGCLNQLRWLQYII